MISDRAKQRFDIEPFLEKISKVIPDDELDNHTRKLKITKG